MVERRNLRFFSFKVKDTGVGIKREELDKLFNYFGKLASTQEMNRQGAGLGLFISRILAKNLGGEILVKSWEGLGSSFEVLVRDQPEEALQQSGALPFSLEE